MKKLPPLALAGWFVLTTATCRAVTLTEKFSTDPSQDGWQVFGDTNLFHWNSTNENLEVTWDSTQTNSYFYHPLGSTVTRNDDFSLEFDLNLSDIASGVEPGKTGPLQISFDFLNFTGATNTSFMRGSYGSVPNVAGFDYYTDGYYVFGDTIYPSAAATVPSFISGVNSLDYAPQTIAIYDNELPTHQTIHISLSYTASNQTAVVSVLTNGVPFSSGPGLALDGSNGFADASDDFSVDTFCICSFSSSGDDYDSVLAHGTVGNVVVNVPPPAQNLAGSFSNGVWQMQFTDHLGWLYTLQRATSFDSWTDVSASAAGNGTNLVLTDALPPTDKAFYRIRADRP